MTILFLPVLASALYVGCGAVAAGLFSRALYFMMNLKVLVRPAA